jgi:hypothetical protein
MQLHMVRSCDKFDIFSTYHIYLTYHPTRLLGGVKAKYPYKVYFFQNDSCINGVKGSFISHFSMFNY